MKKIFFVCACSIILYVSCLKDKGALPIAVNPSTCDSLDVTYATTIAPIISTKCAIPTCHVAGGNGNFTSYEGVKAKVDNNSFQNKVLVEGSMPPTGPLPEDEKEKIQCWLNAGAPNN